MTPGTENVHGCNDALGMLPRARVMCGCRLLSPDTTCALQSMCGCRCARKMHATRCMSVTYLVAWRGGLRLAGAPARETAGGGGMEAHPVPPKGFSSSLVFSCASAWDGVGGSRKEPGSGAALPAAAPGGSGARGGSWKTLPRRVDDCSDAPLPALLPTWLLRALCRPRACIPGCRNFMMVMGAARVVSIAGPVSQSISLSYVTTQLDRFSLIAESPARLPRAEELHTALLPRLLETSGSDGWQAHRRGSARAGRRLGVPPSGAELRTRCIQLLVGRVPFCLSALQGLLQPCVLGAQLHHLQGRSSAARQLSKPHRTCVLTDTHGARAVHLSS